MYYWTASKNLSVTSLGGFAVIKEIPTSKIQFTVKLHKRGVTPNGFFQTNEVKSNVAKPPNVPNIAPSLFALFQKSPASKAGSNCA